MAIMKFKQFITETETGESTLLEAIIVAAWNGEEIPKSKVISFDAGSKIVKYLKEQGITGDKAFKLENKGVNVTKEWAQFWVPESVPSSTKTPKTDIIIGTNRISVKMGAAQLMSGGQNESKATFYAAAQSTGGITEELQSVWSKMDELAKSSVASANIETQLKIGKDEILVKANQVNKEVMSGMRKIFNTNSKFRRAFVKEAMTGEIKFSKSSDAFAEYILSTTATGDKSYLYKSTDESFLNKVAEKISVTVRFKSTSIKSKGIKTGEYRYWTVVSLGIKKLKEEIQSAGNLLTENAFVAILQRVKSYMSSLFLNIWNKIKNSIKKILEFFEIEPVIDFNNEINFHNI
jgi:hypothetical protein